MKGQNGKVRKKIKFKIRLLNLFFFFLTFRRNKLRHSLHYRDYLCAEYRISGYLLQNDSNYPLQVACMWVGGEMNASCGLIPSTEKPFGYHEPHEWRRMLFVCFCQVNSLKIPCCLFLEFLLLVLFLQPKRKGLKRRRKLQLEITIHL